MKKGSAMLKYCTGASKPHFRQFVISKDEKKLIWGSPNKAKAESQVKLTEIKKMLTGQKTAVFTKYKNPETEKRSFSILYKDRSLDIVATDLKQFKIWVQGLKFLLSHLEDKERQKKIQQQLNESKSSEGEDYGEDYVKSSVDPLTLKKEFFNIGDGYSWGFKF
jgi:hypothetical protein